MFPFGLWRVDIVILWPEGTITLQCLHGAAVAFNRRDITPRVRLSKRVTDDSKLFVPCLFPCYFEIFKHGWDKTRQNSFA